MKYLLTFAFALVLLASPLSRAQAKEGYKSVFETSCSKYLMEEGEEALIGFIVCKGPRGSGAMSYWRCEYPGDVMEGGSPAYHCLPYEEGKPLPESGGFYIKARDNKNVLDVLCPKVCR